MSSLSVSIALNALVVKTQNVAIRNKSNMEDHKSVLQSSFGPQKEEFLYKVLVIGELGCGKTAFIKRYVHNFFSANYRATIGVDFALKVLDWDESTIIRLQLWDIAGNEESRGII